MIALALFTLQIRSQRFFSVGSVPEAEGSAQAETVTYVKVIAFTYAASLIDCRLPIDIIFVQQNLILHVYSKIASNITGIVNIVTF